MYRQITTRRLTLRQLTSADLQSTHAYAADKEITQYMMFLPKHSIEETRQFILGAEAEWQKETPDFLEYAVCLDGIHIGGVSLYISEDRSDGELGWIINKQYWGHGYAAEAAQGLADYAIKQLRIPRLIAHCDVKNAASRRVMEKLGMTLVSVSERVYPNGKAPDSEEYMYELRAHN